MSDIVGRARDEAALCRAETADDVAALLDALADEIERLRAELAAAKREYREGGQSRPVREWENLSGSAPNATGSLSSEAFAVVAGKIAANAVVAGTVAANAVTANVRKQRDDDWP